MMIPLSEALSMIQPHGSERSVKLFQHGTMELKMYAPRGTDPQRPHKKDEMYVIAQGIGEFVNEGQRHKIQSGDFLFAPTGVPHRFENFSDDFYTWVMFYGPEGGELKKTK